MHFFSFFEAQSCSIFGTLFKVTRHKINIKLKECNQIITFKVSSVYEDYKQQHSFIHIGGLDVCLRRITFCRNTNKTIKRNSFFIFSFLLCIKFNFLLLMKHARNAEKFIESTLFVWRLNRKFLYYIAYYIAAIRGNIFS